MPRFAHTLLLGASILLALTACVAPVATGTGAGVAIAPTDTPAPTATPVPPSPTPVPPTETPRIAKDVIIAGVAVGGMAPDEARAALERELAPLLRPLDVRAGDAQLTLDAEALDLSLPLDAMIEQALEEGAGARVPLQISYNGDKLHAALEELAEQVDVAPELTVITSTDTLSRSFALAGGQRLDISAAIGQIDERLQSLGGARRVTLTLSPPEDGDARPTPEQLQEQLEEMAKSWKGVAGIYVYDLASGQAVASVNANSVFAAASTIKMPILLNAYINLKKFTARQETALKKMIVESDNLAANTMLAASVGGGGTEEALLGAERMSAMLKDLGLEFTYLYVPFEATDYLRINKIKYKCGPKDPVGEAPYTSTGCALRTTPAEMAQLYVYLEQCASGEGVLLEQFAETLTAERCKEMIARLEQNGDHKRMMAGLPPGTRVAHKSGWIADMQADVGIVRSPGGDFVVAIYLYQKLGANQVPIPDRIMQSSIADFARLVYSYYNPVPAPAP